MQAHVWLARRDSADPAGLSPRELLRRNKYQQEDDRERFTTGATLARYALRRLTMDQSAEVHRECPECKAQDHGPVGAAGAHAGEWSLSVSHSGDLVAVAIVPGPEAVGVDVEVADLETINRVRRLLCRDDELAEDLAAPDLHEALLVRWVRKEAILKAARIGLGVPMRHLRVSSSAEPAALLSWSERSVPDGFNARHVVCEDLPPEVLAAGDDRSRGAIAVRGTSELSVRLHWVGAELAAVRAHDTSPATELVGCTG
ncbi:4'-phosphopantetheinyl transferase family protein [Flexivirga meconopsidis]|uniref:4'-phosphopantetheinyl transferase family protein n=1 Tax=Flexivirga meconopsidis TaxID=2977121 RepID=UPI00223ECD57|nr:4'-phosphopantetheinyl transferase superfamily protein [Flexivirga meconopsidis]